MTKKTNKKADKPAAKKSGKRVAKKTTPRVRASHEGNKKPLNTLKRNLRRETPQVKPEVVELSASEIKAVAAEAKHNSETMDCFVNAPDRSNITNS